MPEGDSVWKAARRRSFDDEIRLVLATDGPTAYALRRPVLDLLETARESEVIGHLGPDLLGSRTRRLSGTAGYTRARRA